MHSLAVHRRRRHRCRQSRAAPRIPLPHPPQAIPPPLPPPLPLVAAPGRQVGDRRVRRPRRRRRNLPPQSPPRGLPAPSQPLRRRNLPQSPPRGLLAPSPHILLLERTTFLLWGISGTGEQHIFLIVLVFLNFFQDHDDHAVLSWQETKAGTESQYREESGTARHYSGKK